MSLSEIFLGELQQEAAATRKMLEAVPDDKLGWKPHEKSMTLGRLAGHIAENPQWAEKTMDRTVLDMASDMKDFKPLDPSSTDELLEAFDKNIEVFKNALTGHADADFGVTWKLVNGDRTSVEMPRAAVIRVWILNHMAHHRGQLSVYLRLLDVPVPSVYGPTADSPAAL